MRLPGLLPGAALLCAAVSATAQTSPQSAPPPALELFFTAASPDDGKARQAMEQLGAGWRDAYAAMIVDIARLMRPAPRRRESAELFAGPDDDTDPIASQRATSGFDVPAPMRRESFIRSRLVGFLERQTNQRFGDDLARWRQWIWSLPDEPHPEYAAFKGFVYAQIDPVMRRFFPPGVNTRIRLDEIDWGGVRVNGIPPLVYPAVVRADEASYLGDGHLVFGVVVNGEARAYPKRILAWHEMAIDRLGGTEVTVVYCTLCGTVIPYESAAGGRVHRFGTSGLLYRSNKLMFDEATMSLWSAIEGKPVVGPLVEQELALTPHAAVTTTWREWREEHPATTVLSIDTGHQRDYREGAAYREYFATDDLYFAVPARDDRLKNKAEVLVFKARRGTAGEQPVAVAADFLKRTPVYMLELDGTRYVIVTSPRGANRVYEAGATTARFGKRTATGVTDLSGGRWRVSEAAITPEDRDQPRLPRVPAQRAFWFGWYAQFPDTLLIK